MTPRQIQIRTPSSPAGGASGPEEALHIARARERILTRERHQVEMMRFVGAQVQTQQTQMQGDGTSFAGAGAGETRPAVVRRRTWFER
jgi:hypothetical protein